MRRIRGCQRWLIATAIVSLHSLAAHATLSDPANGWDLWVPRRGPVKSVEWLPAEPAGGGIAWMRPPAEANEPAAEAITDNPSRTAGAVLEPKKSLPYWRRNVFGRIFSDQKFLVVEWWPNEFRRPGFTAPLLGATVLAASSPSPSDSAFDFRIGRSLNSGPAGPSTQTAGELTRIGNGPAIAAALGATYLAARWTGHDKMAATTSLSFEAMVDAGIWIEVLKRTFARVRPNQPGEGGFFQFGAQQNSSFPSGHSMGSFAVATVFAEQYSDKRWVPWVAYGTAGLIGMSRIALGRHFPSDVIAGAILGNSIARGVIARQNGDDIDPRWTHHITPIVDPSGAGIGVAYSKSW